jgi:hypothetical protein
MKHLRLKPLNFLCCGRKTSNIDLAASPKHPSDTELVQRSSEALFPPKPRCAFTAIAVSEHDSVARSPFFTKFQPEIRLQIYKYALFIANDDGYCVVTKEKGIPEPPLLLTCKAIRKEAIETFYHQNWFLLVLKDWDPAADVLMTRKTRLLGFNELDFLQHCDEGRRWANLLKWLRFYHAGEAHALGPQPSKKMFPSEGGDRPMIGPAKWGFIDSMFKIVAAMKEKPWEEARKIIEGLRIGLYVLEPGWGVD